MDVGVRLTYAIATIALFPALIALIPVLDPGGSPGTATWVTLAVAWPLLLLLAVHEWRRDRYALAMFGVVVTFVVAMVGGSLGAMAATTAGQVRGIGLGVLATALLAASIAVIVRERRMKDEVPDHLLARFGPDAMLETEGVVWAVTSNPTDGDLLGLVTVFVQSNLAAARTLQLELEPVAGFWSRRGGLAVAAVAPFELPAGRLACCCIPVAPGVDPVAKAHLYVHVRAKGPAGRRIRKHRGRAATRRTTTAFQLFALLGGHLVWGGGVRATFENPSRRTSDLPPPVPTWRTLAADELRHASGVLAEGGGRDAEGLF